MPRCAQAVVKFDERNLRPCGSLMNVRLGTALQRSACDPIIRFYSMTRKRPADPGSDAVVQAGLDSIVAEIRAEYRRTESKPRYLGDNNLPQEMELKLMEIARAREIREKAVAALELALHENPIPKSES